MGSQLAEIEGLARAIDLSLVESLVVTIKTPHAATLMGTGKVDELRSQIIFLGVELVIVNASLTPSQQRNLERAWQVKILDRTGLILEIFMARARTREARLQVSLAQEAYQRTRLVRSWTHLERQRGGAGFMGGPGERQIESDRRQISARIAKLKQQLKLVQQRRRRMRSARQKAAWPVVALVGYTNAGKSTLFNLLTDASKPARNRLFDTLDPTMRAFALPDGQQAILSDTVGFISDLPHDLIAAFRATLEEVSEADIVVHVRDISHRDSLAQKSDVEAILNELYRQDDKPPVIEVLNKIDLVEDMSQNREGDHHPILLSAATSEGVELLRARIGKMLNEKKRTGHFRVRLTPCQARASAFLYEKGRVLHQSHDGEGAAMLDVMLPIHAEGAFRKKFGDLLDPVKD